MITYPGLAAGAAALHVADLLPTTTAIAPLRRRVAPGLSGFGAGGHVALTFDDGPDAHTTPQLLDRLHALDVRATFFVLASRVLRLPGLGRRLLADGHEIALHGYVHRPHVLRTAAGVIADLRRGYRVITEVTGRPPCFWRPPHGIATAAGLVTARSLRLRPVLWTTDARDWRPDRDAARINADLRRTVRGGDTVLLHEGLLATRPERTASDVLDDLVTWCRACGWQVGPLADHWRQDAPSWT